MVVWNSNVIHSIKRCFSGWGGVFFFGWGGGPSGSLYRTDDPHCPCCCLQTIRFPHFVILFFFPPPFSKLRQLNDWQLLCFVLFFSWESGIKGSDVLVCDRTLCNVSLGYDENCAVWKDVIDSLNSLNLLALLQGVVFQHCVLRWKINTDQLCFSHGVLSRYMSDIVINQRSEASFLTFLFFVFKIYNNYRLLEAADLWMLSNVFGLKNWKKKFLFSVNFFCRYIKYCGAQWWSKTWKRWSIVKSVSSEGVKGCKEKILLIHITEPLYAKKKRDMFEHPGTHWWIKKLQLFVSAARWSWSPCLVALYPFQFRCVDSTAAGVAAAAAFAEICLQSSEANSGTQPGGTKKICFQYTELLYSSVFIF